MAEPIVASIVLDLDKVKTQLDKLESDSKRQAAAIAEAAGSGIEKSFSNLASSFTKFFAGLGATLGAAFTFKEAIHAAREQQASIDGLNAALRVTGQFTSEASRSLIHLSESLQRTTGVADETILSGEKLLLTLGQLSTDAVPRATRAAIDLAAGLNIDVDSAFKLVSKSAQGATEGLSRYGIRVKETGDRSADFANVLGQIEARFQGLAAARMNTFEGSLTNIKNSFSDILEEFGGIIVKSPTVIAVFNEISRVFFTFADTLKKAFTGRDFVGELLGQFVVFATGVNDLLIRPLELFYNLGKIVFDVLKLGIQGIVHEFANVGLVVTTLLSKISPKFEEAKGFFQDFSQSSLQTVQQFTDETKSSFQNAFNFDAATASQNYITKFSEFLSVVRPPVQEAGNQIAQDLNKVNSITFDQVTNQMALAANKIQVSAAGIAKSINMGLVQGIGNGFAALGKSLITGENLFAAFGKAVLASFGQVLITLGTQTIAVGIGMSAVPLLFGLQGAAAVAAGAAMVTAGGVLTALAGSGGGGGAGAGVSAGAGGTGVGVGFGTDTAFGVNPSDLQKEAQTKIEVVVQGNVLDRRQTGLELVEVINEAFGSQGLTFAEARA